MPWGQKIAYVKQAWISNTVRPPLARSHTRRCATNGIMQTFVHSSARWCALFNNGPSHVCALNSGARARERIKILFPAAPVQKISLHSRYIRTRFFGGVSDFLHSRIMSFCRAASCVRERVNGLANFEHALLCTLFISMDMQIRRRTLIRRPLTERTWWLMVQRGGFSHFLCAHSYLNVFSDSLRFPRCDSHRGQLVTRCVHLTHAVICYSSNKDRCRGNLIF